MWHDISVIDFKFFNSVSTCKEIFDKYFDQIFRKEYAPEKVQALNEFVGELEKNNTQERPNAVEYSLVYFNKNAHLSVDWTNDGTRLQSINPRTGAVDISSALQKLPTDSGTNWAHALALAEEQYNKKASEKDLTVVIFMTDGAPSQYWAKELTSFYVDGEGSYLGARDEARDLVNSGALLYGLFSYGPAADFNNNYIGSLVNYAYNDPNAEASYKMEARDKTDLSDNLGKILNYISGKVGFSDVTIHDGITELTTVTFEDVDPESFVYTITYKDYNEETSTYEEKTLDVDVTGEGNNQLITIPRIPYHILKDLFG